MHCAESSGCAWRFPVLVLISVLIAAACMLSSCGAPSFSPDLEQRVEESLEEIMGKLDIPGAVGVFGFRIRASLS